MLSNFEVKEGGRRKEKLSHTISRGLPSFSLTHTNFASPPSPELSQAGSSDQMGNCVGKERGEEGGKEEEEKRIYTIAAKQPRRRPNELSRIQEVTGETSLLRAKKEGFSRRNTWYSEAFFPPCAVRETYECMCVKCSVKTTASFSSQWSPPPSPPPPPSVGKVREEKRGGRA